MEHKEFELVVREACQCGQLPAALAYFKSVADEDVAQAAESLVGQFALAEVEGERRVYHVSLELNDDGVEQEYVELVMNEDDDVVKFVAWFFDTQFGIKAKEVYQAAGKTYQQPKRSL
jgi:ribonucleotide monophosphatase NagD (HAD superfamily)